MSRRSPLTNMMVRAAEEAAKLLRRDFGDIGHLQVSKKGPADFVSKADTAAEAVIRRILDQAKPEAGFWGEESGASGDQSTSRWIVDPLDGTTNFLHGMPHWGISLALEDQGQISHALVYDVLRDELFWAEQGVGAFLGGKRLKVTGRESLAQALLVAGLPHLGRPVHPRAWDQVRRLSALSAGVRRSGSAALDLAYVAAGRFDAYWEASLNPWDVAAGLLLCREAGAVVCDYAGQPIRHSGHEVVAAAPLLADQVIAQLKDPQ